MLRPNLDKSSSLDGCQKQGSGQRPQKKQTHPQSQLFKELDCIAVLHPCHSEVLVFIWIYCLLWLPLAVLLGILVGF